MDQPPPRDSLGNPAEGWVGGDISKHEERSDEYHLSSSTGPKGRRPSDVEGGGAAADPAGKARAGPSEQRAPQRSAAALLRRPQRKEKRILRP